MVSTIDDYGFSGSLDKRFPLRLFHARTPAFLQRLGRGLGDCAESEDSAKVEKPLGIRVITPYGGQVGFIKDRICNHPSMLKRNDSDKVVDVQVKTVDSFQGIEKDIIILSLVRANQAGIIGFVNDERRLIVALTRCRYAVWVLGSAVTLKAHSKIWRNLIADARRTNSFVETTPDGGMIKVNRSFQLIRTTYMLRILHQKLETG